LLICDGTFKPDQPVTRAQFAAIIRQAFNESRQIRGFADVPANWAALRFKKPTGFMAGYPGIVPAQPGFKVQVLVSLASGFTLPPFEADEPKYV